MTGRCISWTLDHGLDHGLDYGLEYGLEYGLYTATDSKHHQSYERLSHGLSQLPSLLRHRLHDFREVRGVVHI